MGGSQGLTKEQMMRLLPELSNRLTNLFQTHPEFKAKTASMQFAQQDNQAELDRMALELSNPDLALNADEQTATMLLGVMSIHQTGTWRAPIFQNWGNQYNAPDYSPWDGFSPIDAVKKLNFTFGDSAGFESDQIETRLQQGDYDASFVQYLRNVGYLPPAPGQENAPGNQNGYRTPTPFDAKNGPKMKPY